MNPHYNSLLPTLILPHQTSPISIPQHYAHATTPQSYAQATITPPQQLPFPPPAQRYQTQRGNTTWTTTHGGLPPSSRAPPTTKRDITHPIRYLYCQTPRIRHGGADVITASNMGKTKTGAKAKNEFAQDARPKGIRLRIVREKTSRSHKLKLVLFTRYTHEAMWGEALLPQNRPRVAMVFIPETQQMRHDGLELNKAVVIDARLRPTHSVQILQSMLMATCHSDFPFPLTHMTGSQYLLLLPPGSDHHRFLLTYTKPLQDLGYVTYPWSPAINGYPMRLKYKVWIELKRMSSQAWAIDHLILAISSFGIVLDHASMTRVASLETMMAVVVVPDLADIPRSLLMWIQGVARSIEVVVYSWIEEPLPLIPPLDTTPHDKFFDKVHHDNVKALTGYTGDAKGKGIVVIDFETFLEVWERLEPGPKKDKIEETLRASPHFAS